MQILRCRWVTKLRSFDRKEWRVPEIGKEEKNDSSDTSHGKQNVPPELLPDDLVSLPSSVDLAHSDHQGVLEKDHLDKGEGSGEAGLFEHPLDSPPCRHVLLRTLKLPILN